MPLAGLFRRAALRLPFTVMLVASPLAVTTVAAQNIALNAPVSVSGSYGLWNAASPNRITNGIFNPEGTVYWSNAISWVGTGTFVDIDLGGRFAINGFRVQADNNDAYLLQYRDAAGYLSAYAVPEFLLPFGGVSTRPLFSLSTPIIATSLRFSAVSGDNLYSVSQIQAFGTRVVPEPGVWALMVTGLAGLAVAGARQRSARHVLPE